MAIDEKIRLSRDAGYTDEEIVKFISEKQPEYKEKLDLSLQSGHSPSEVLNFLSPKKEPSLAEQGTEKLAQFLSRALESTYGLPGDVEAFIRPLIAEHQKEEGGLIGQISEKRIFPTSSELRQLQKEEHGQKFEPKGKAEELTGEIIQDYIFSPGGPVKKLALSTLGVGAQEIAKQFGASEEQAVTAKIATTFLGSFLGKKNVKDYYKDEYKKATAAIPQGAKVNAQKIEQSLLKIESDINKGLKVPSTSPAREAISEIIGKIKNGEISIESLDQIYHNLNEKLFDITDKKIKEKAQHWINKVKNTVAEELKDYGKSNKAYYKSFIDANAAFKGLKDSQKASEVLKKWKKAALIGGPTALIAEAIFLGPKEAAATGAVAGGAYGLVKGYELQKRIFSNPTLFKYYTNALKAAANENRGQFIKNSVKLDKNLREKNLESSKFADIVRESKKNQRRSSSSSR